MLKLKSKEEELIRAESVMKTFSLIISLSVLMISGYFLVTDFKISDEANHLIYMSLLLVLMLICVVGILINMPIILTQKRRMRQFVYNKFSRRTMKSRRLEINFEPS